MKGRTKTSKWKGGPETVRVQDAVLIPALKVVWEHMGRNEEFFAGSYATFNTLLRRYASRLGLTDSRLSGYSLRRGGAAALFAKCGAYDRVTEAGRWSQTRTARLYIDGALHDIANLDLAPEDLLLVGEAKRLASAVLRLKLPAW